MLELTDTVAQIGVKINKAFAEEINNVLHSRKVHILAKCKSLAIDFISESPALKSLSDPTPGSLRGQFGLLPGQGDLVSDEVRMAVANSVEVRFIPFDEKFRGGFDVNFQPSNFSNLLGLSSGHTIYKRGDLHWMDWLLTQGDRIIVVNYMYNPQTGIGRSMLGNMKEGGVFRVPPTFSGTVNDNFVTRALIGKHQETAISNIFQQELS